MGQSGSSSVILTGTLLFTDANVEMPATLFGRIWRKIGSLLGGLRPP